MSRRRGVLHWLLVGAAGVAAGITVCCTTLAGYIWLSQEGTGATGAQCALVFGSAAYGFDTPGPAMLRRVSTAVRLYHEGSVERLVVSGGKTSPTDQSEAEVMSRYARRQNVNQRDISMEDASRSTWQNLLYSKPLLDGCENVVAISDGYHLGRIRLFAWLQGWGNLPTIPADEQPSSVQLRHSLAREFLATIYYMIVVPLAGDPDAVPDPS